MLCFFKVLLVNIALLALFTQAETPIQLKVKSNSDMLNNRGVSSLHTGSGTSYLYLSNSSETLQYDEGSGTIYGNKLSNETKQYLNTRYAPFVQLSLAASGDSYSFSGEEAGASAAASDSGSDLSNSGNGSNDGGNGTTPVTPNSNGTTPITPNNGTVANSTNDTTSITAASIDNDTAIEIPDSDDGTAIYSSSIEPSAEPSAETVVIAKRADDDNLLLVNGTAKGWYACKNTGEPYARSAYQFELMYYPESKKAPNSCVDILVYKANA